MSQIPLGISAYKQPDGSTGSSYALSVSKSVAVALVKNFVAGEAVSCAVVRLLAGEVASYVPTEIIDSEFGLIEVFDVESIVLTDLAPA